MALHKIIIYQVFTRRERMWKTERFHAQRPEENQGVGRDSYLVHWCHPSCHDD